MSVVIAPAGMAVRSAQSIDAALAFCARVAELGGVVLEPSWLGTDRPHRVRCAAGHTATPRPSDVKQGTGICRVCAGNDPATAEAAFRARVAELGGVVLEPSWLGVESPHRVRCPYGHEADPRPHDVMAGSGMCRRCAYRVWDRFYVVVNRVAARVKFGITSGDPRLRLAVHRRSGYAEVPRDVAVRDALELERSCRKALSLAGVSPVRGREYFDLSSALPVVLDVVDNWPGSAGG